MIDLNLRPDRKLLRGFGWIALGFFGLLGGVVYWKKSIVGIHLGPDTARLVTGLLWGVGGISGLLSLLRPEWNRFLFIGMSLVAFPIGFVLSHLILALIYFGIMTPIGLFFRLIRRDALHRKLDRQAASYWVTHRPVESVERYFRQY